MSALKRWKFLLLAVGVLSTGVYIAAQEPSEAERRERAIKAMTAGNFKNAYEDFRKLALDARRRACGRLAPVCRTRR